MKFIALLMVTILLGAIGMEEVKTTYAQPDRDEHLLTKEIITGVLAQNVLSDTANGIPMFEKYDFPLDVRKASDVSVYETSGGDAYFETIEKMKERIYQPVFAQAGSENLVKLTYKPNVRNLRHAPKYNLTSSPETNTHDHAIEGLPQGVSSTAYYWDGETEAFLFYKEWVYSYIDGKLSTETPELKCYLMDKNAKIFKAFTMSYPTNTSYKTLNFDSASEYDTSMYVYGRLTDGLGYDYYFDENGNAIPAENFGEEINPRNVIVKFDFKSKTSKVVFEIPSPEQREQASRFSTERYIMITTSKKVYIFDKKQDKIHVIAGTNNGSLLNPVLRSVAVLVGANVWDIYTFNDDGVTKIASSVSGDDAKYTKYVLVWVGNLDYDYIVNKNGILSNDVNERVVAGGGRGHYQINFGNVEYDNSFRYTKNGQRVTYNNYSSYYRRSNVDDADIVRGFNGGDGYDYYAPDRKNFLPFEDIAGYIRLWRKDKAVLSVEWGVASTTYKLHWYD